MSKPVAQEGPFFIGAANALAGACGGVSAMTLIYPLDVIRCRLQAQADALSKRASIIEENDKRFTTGMENIDENTELFKKSVSPDTADETAVDEVMQSIDRTIDDDRRKQRSSISNCIQDIMREEGIQGFYKALDSQLVGIFYSDIVYFFTVTFVKQYMYGKREVSALSNLKASTLAGVLNVLFTTPYWTAQTQLMLQKKSKNNAKSRRGQGRNEMNELNEMSEMSEVSENSSEGESRDYTGLMDALVQIYKKEGLNGYYKGLGPAMLLVSNPIIQFVSYEELIRVLKYYQHTGQLSNLTYFVCGAMAKSLATVVTYPLQVMKTQLQKRDSKFNNMTECLKFLAEKVQKGDIRPLYSGLAAKLWQTVLNSAIKYMIYEKMLEVVLTLLRRLRAMLFMAMVANVTTLKK